MNKYLEEKYGKAINEIKRDDNILKDILLNEQFGDILNIFDSVAWTEENADLFLKKIFDIYKSSNHFKIPIGLYNNSKVFNYLLESNLFIIDNSFIYKLPLSEDEIEKYINYLIKTKAYIKNQDNFISSNKLLKRILEKELISYFYSFKKSAWDQNNIILFSKILMKKNINIPKALTNNSHILTICITQNYDLDGFESKAWTEENINYFINKFDGKNIPKNLYSSPIFLKYYINNGNINNLSYFKEEAWTEENISLFEKKLLNNPISPSEFPLVFMFNNKILYFLLTNDLYEYLDLFIANAWSEENISLFKKLLKLEYIDFIPRALKDNNSILAYCIENNLLIYTGSFVSSAWDIKNSRKYICESASPIKITEYMKQSKEFAITLIMYGHYDKLLDFPIKSTPDEYVEIMFEYILNDKDKCRIVYSKYSDIKDEQMKQNFRNYIIRNKNNISHLDDVVQIFQNINYSNSLEIKRAANEISDIVLSKDEPKKEFKKIEKIFLSDELPKVAKVYNVFRIFHTDLKGKLWINPFKKISPVLKRYSTLDFQKHSIMAESIIFSDLLKSYTESNNMEFKKYLKDLKAGSDIFNKLFFREKTINLSDDEIIILKRYLKKLTALYNQTLKGKKNNYILTGNIDEDVNNLTNLFKVKDNPKKLLDRLVKMYAYFIGIDSYDDLINRIKSKVEIADSRGRKYEKNPFTIEKGDFIKGIKDIKFLPYILNNGVLASELLGADATEKGDSTPYDTDMSIVDKQTDIAHLFDNNYVALDFGDTWIVLKNEGNISITRDKHSEISTPNYESNKLEAYYTGILSEDHYGIRTGFPSTDISYFITREYTKEFGFEIARSGFYIPVLDTSGKLLFTSQMFDEIRKQMNGLSYYGVDNYKFSDNLSFPDIEDEINELKKTQNEVIEKENIIRENIYNALKEYNLEGVPRLDGNLTRNIYNLISIGSTGRGTQSDSSDFDFILLLDQKIINDEKMMNEIIESIILNLDIDEIPELNYKNDIRLKDVKINGTKVNIDISFEGKTDIISYSSDMALKDRIKTMKKESLEKSILVKANIIKAKKLLKEAGVYKSITSREMEGGLGGAGIENWILSSGGSFIDASISFLKAYDEAYKKSETKYEESVFIEFSNIYNIWNFGENFYALRSLSSLHNEFVSCNMNGTGLKKMADTIRNYLKKINVLDDSIITKQ